MGDLINADKVNELLNWAYEKAVNGFPGVDSAEDMAREYLSHEGTLEEKVNSLIRWQIAKAGTAGFLTGLGGLITLPVAIPANLATVTYVQVRMIASIAFMGGLDIKSDKVKTLVFACLAGDSAMEVVRNAGVQFGKKLTEAAIKNISGAALKKINQAVGFRFITKAGEKGLINLTKLVPVLGGVVGGTVDAVTTNVIGNAARKVFVESAESSPANHESN